MADLKLFVGYFGRNNLGDDLMLKSLYTDNKDFVFLQDSNYYDYIPLGHQIILSLNPILRLLQKLFFLIKLKIEGVKIIVFGGGTQFSTNSSKFTQIEILFFLIISKLLRYKIKANSIGIGAFSEGKWIVKNSINLLDEISVRDHTSSEKLAKEKIKHTLVNDLVYKINFKKEKKRNSNNILITATGPVLLSNKKYLNNYLNFVRKNVKTKDSNLIFAVFQKNEDEFIHELLIKSFPRIKIITPKSIEELEDLYNNSKEVLGMRYHSLVIADIFDIPFSGFSYDDKVKDLCFKRKRSFTPAN